MIGAGVLFCPRPIFALADFRTGAHRLRQGMVDCSGFYRAKTHGWGGKTSGPLSRSLCLALFLSAIKKWRDRGPAHSGRVAIVGFGVRKRAMLFEDDSIARFVVGN